MQNTCHLWSGNMKIWSEPLPAELEVSWVPRGDGDESGGDGDESDDECGVGGAADDECGVNGDGDVRDDECGVDGGGHDHVVLMVMPMMVMPRMVSVVLMVMPMMNGVDGDAHDGECGVDGDVNNENSDTEQQ